MPFRKLALATAALGLTAAPVAAHAAPVSRASAPAPEASELGGGDLVRALIIVFIAAIGMGALLLTDDNNPTSP